MFADIIISFMLYITLRQYTYVTAVARAGSLTEAAQALSVSQPSLSVAITRVEERLGQRIFIRRKGTAVVLTPFGHRFVERAQTLLADAETLETGTTEGDPFTLACFEDIAPWYLAPALRALQDRLPDIPFRIREGRFDSLAADLAQGRADIVLSYDLGFGDEFGRALVKRVSPAAFLRAGHRLAGRTQITLADLDGEPLITFAEDQSARHVGALFRRLGLTMNVAHRTASLEMMRSLAAHGAGVGISYSVPPLARSYDDTPLVTVPIGGKDAVAEIVLVWSLLSPPHRRFDEIREILQEL